MSVIAGINGLDRVHVEPDITGPVDDPRVHVTFSTFADYDAEGEPTVSITATITPSEVKTFVAELLAAASTVRARSMHHGDG